MLQRSAARRDACAKSRRSGRQFRTRAERVPRMGVCRRDPDDLSHPFTTRHRCTHEHSSAVGLSVFGIAVGCLALAAFARIAHAESVYKCRARRRRDRVPGSSLRGCAGRIHRRDRAGAAACAVAGLRSRAARGPRRARTRRVVRACRRKAIARCGVLCMPRSERRAVLPAWRLPEADRGARRIRSRDRADDRPRARRASASRPKRCRARRSAAGSPAPARSAASGHEHDESISTYDRNLGRDPCRYL